MTAPRVEVHIETLELEGMPAVDTASLPVAVEKALGELLVAGEMPAHLSRPTPLREILGPDLVSVGELASNIARALWEGQSR